MLVLTRKANEGILIGSDVRITVVRVADGRVKLGIEAPEKVRLLREELAERGPGERLPSIARRRPMAG